MSVSVAADIAYAEGLVRQALEAAPRSPLAHSAKGQLLRVQRRYAEAIAEYETALAFNRNWVRALGPLGQCKLFCGSIDELIPLVERAIRLSPRDPFIGVWYFRIGAFRTQSFGSIRHAVPIPNYHMFTPAWPRPMLLEARPNNPPLSSPKRGD